MNAIKFLIKEHDKVRRTFAMINKKSSRYSTKTKMFAQLCQDLIRHETMEQKIWYPHLRNNKKIYIEVKHLIGEEKDAKKTIKKLKIMKKNPTEWEKKFPKFKKDVLHHAHEEEHKLFPNVKKVLDEAELEKIGNQMRKFKMDYIKKHNKH